MPTIAEVRQQYPQYNDLSDDQLAGALHQKYYSDMPEQEFRAKIGLPPAQQAAPQQAAPAAQPQAQPDQPWSGAILPFSGARPGDAHFDSNAGLLGAVKGFFSPPANPMGPEGHPTDEAIQWGANAAMMASPVSAASQAGERAIPGVAQSLRREKPPVPTSEELRAAGSAGYDAARAMGVDYHAGAVADMASTIRAGLERDGILPILAPKSSRILKMLESPPPGAGASLGGLDAARRALRNAASDFNNPTEQLAAQRIIEGIDRFTENPDPASVVAGPAAAAGATQAEARGNYATAMRSRQIASTQQKSELRAAASNSGANGDNALRQRVVDILTSPKKSAGYSKEELGMMDEFARGTRTRNITRRVANLLGGGGGLGSVVTGMAGVGAGGYALGPGGALAGAAMPMLGWGAKKAQNVMARKAMAAIDEQVRRRSPLYQQMLKDARVEAAPPTKRAALIRMLMMSAMSNANAGGAKGGGAY